VFNISAVEAAVTELGTNSMPLEPIPNTVKFLKTVLGEALCSENKQTSNLAGIQENPVQIILISTEEYTTRYCTADARIWEK
jgi:hypothetical protein